jgi:hypothetical protein
MNTNSITNRAATAALAAALSIIPAVAVRADIQDYEFQLIQNEIKRGDGVAVAVRLINKSSGQPVPDAVIFATRMDMAPDGMAAMTTPIEAIPSTEPGVYNFKTNLVMEGGWRLSLAAKVQGEDETLQEKLILKAVP